MNEQIQNRSAGGKRARRISFNDLVYDTGDINLDFGIAKTPVRSCLILEGMLVPKGANP